MVSDQIEPSLLERDVASLEQGLSETVRSLEAREAEQPAKQSVLEQRLLALRTTMDDAVARCVKLNDADVVLSEALAVLQAEAEQLDERLTQVESGDAGSDDDELEEDEYEDDEDEETLADQFAECETTLVDIVTRIAALENVQQRLPTLTASIEELKSRLEAADGNEEEDLSSLLKAFETSLEELGTDLDTAETDVDEDVLSTASDTLSDLEGRIKTLEEIAPRLVPLQGRLGELTTRLSAADGDSTNALSELLDAFKDELEELGRDLDTAEEGVDGDVLSEHQDTLDDLQTRIEALEKVMHRLTLLQTSLREVDGRATELDRQDLSRFLTQIERLKDRIAGIIDAIEEDNPAETLSTLEAERDELEGRLTPLERLHRQTVTVQADITDLHTRANGAK